MYVGMYVCKYVCMYVCMYACAYKYFYVDMSVSLYVCMYQCIYACATLSETPQNYRSLLQKRPMKEIIFCIRDLKFQEAYKS